MPIPDSNISDVTRQSTPSESNQPQFNDTIRRGSINGVECFSLVDIMIEFSDTEADARTYWRDTKKRLKKDGFQLYEKISQLKLPAKDGKQRLTDVADRETCLRIVQSIPSPKAEPIRQWLAALGETILQEQENPLIGIRNNERRLAYHKRRYLQEQLSRGETVDAALAALPERIEAVDTFKAMMAEVKRLNDRANYGQLVNAEYVNLFQHTSEQLKKILDTKNIRDALPAMQLSYVKAVEQSITVILKRSNHMSNDQLHKSFVLVSQRFGDMLAEFCDMAGVDRVTGKPLLKAGQ